jgi:hypothetical protein
VTAYDSVGGDDRPYLFIINQIIKFYHLYCRLS